MKKFKTFKSDYKPTRCLLNEKDGYLLVFSDTEPMRSFKIEPCEMPGDKKYEIPENDMRNLGYAKKYNRYYPLLYISTYIKTRIGIYRTYNDARLAYEIASNHKDKYTSPQDFVNFVTAEMKRVKQNMLTDKKTCSNL